MPAPTTAKEIKQFLGLIGYYRKFIPRFADIARPMTNLTRQDVPFEWTVKCQAPLKCAVPIPRLNMDCMLLLLGCLLLL